MTKFYYTAIKHRRLFAFIAVLIIGFTIISVTTRDIVYANPVVALPAAIESVVGALLAAGGFKTSSDNLNNISKDVIFSSSPSLLDWIKMAAGGLVTSMVNPLLIPPTLLKEFCTTIKGSVISGINGVAEDIGYKFDTTTATNAAGESNPMIPDFINGHSCTFQDSHALYGYIKNYCANPVFSNAFYGYHTGNYRTGENYKEHYNFSRMPLFKVKSTGEIYFLSLVDVNSRDVYITDSAGKKFSPPKEFVQCINGRDNSISPESFVGGFAQPYKSGLPNVLEPIGILMTGLSTANLPLVSFFGIYNNLYAMTLAFNPELVDVLVGDFTVPVNKFGDTGLKDLSDFADTQITDGVLDIPINIPIGDDGKIVIPANPSDIIEISTPATPDPKPDPDPLPNPDDSFLEIIVKVLKSILLRVSGVGDFFDTFFLKLFEFIENKIIKAQTNFHEFKESIYNIIRSIPTAIENLFTNLKEFFGDIIKSMGSFFKDVLDFIKTIPQLILDFMTKFKEVLSLIISPIGTAITSVLDFLKTIPKLISDAFVSLLDFIKTIPKAITDFFVGLIDGFKSLAATIGDFFGKILGFISNLANSVLDFLKMAFIPKADYFPDKFTEMRTNLETKLPVVAQFSGFMGAVNTQLSNSPDTNGRPSFPITVWGTTFELIDFSLFDPYLKLFQSIVLVFAYFFFIRRYFSKIASLIGGYKE